jgi:hypothetical protein
MVMQRLKCYSCICRLRFVSGKLNKFSTIGVWFLAGKEIVHVMTANRMALEELTFLWGLSGRSVMWLHLMPKSMPLLWFSLTCVKMIFKKRSNTFYGNPLISHVSILYFSILLRSFYTEYFFFCPSMCYVDGQKNINVTHSLFIFY